jgi:hypothetical protein
MGQLLQEPCQVLQGRYGDPGPDRSAVTVARGLPRTVPAQTCILEGNEEGLFI